MFRHKRLGVYPQLLNMKICGKQNMKTWSCRRSLESSGAALSLKPLADKTKHSPDSKRRKKSVKTDILVVKYSVSTSYWCPGSLEEDVVLTDVCANEEHQRGITTNLYTQQTPYLLYLPKWLITSY